MFTWSYTVISGFKLKFPNCRGLIGGSLLAQSINYVGVGVAFGLHGDRLDAF